MRIRNLTICVHKAKYYHIRIHYGTEYKNNNYIDIS